MTKRKSANSASRPLTLNVDQMECLVSPVRVDIVEALRLAGRASIAELAARLGRTPHSLYHHIRQLERCRLILVCGTRRSGSREEAIYTLKSPRFAIAKNASDPLYRRQAVKALRLVLRKAEREHRRAQEAVVSGAVDGKEIRMLRLALSLSSRDAATLRRKLAELGEWARQRETIGGGRLYSLTGLVTPVVDETGEPEP